MLIGICGSICSGKSTVARYLVDHHCFKQVSVEPSATEPAHEQETSPSETETDGSNTHLKRPSSTALVFPTSHELMEYVTQRWRERWVMTDVMGEEALDAYSRRPFFLLISVDAPLLVRWQRYQRRRHELVAFGGAKQPTAKPPPDGQHTCRAETLEDFVTLSDAQLYHPETGQATHISSAPVRLLNTSNSLAHLYASLGKLDLLSSERLRPGWDSYFMALASLAARRSNCMKRRVGCVVVSQPDCRVISTGYNGTARGIRNCGEGGCPRCNAGVLGSGQGLSTCLCIHAEENALLEAGRDRLRGGGRVVLYCDTCPCLTCSIKIAQVGVSEVVYAQGYSMDAETAEVFREAGVRLRQFIPPANGLIHLQRMEYIA